MIDRIRFAILWGANSIALALAYLVIFIGFPMFCLTLLSIDPLLGIGPSLMLLYGLLEPFCSKESQETPRAQDH
jgi:hypothetical protein